MAEPRSRAVPPANRPLAGVLPSELPVPPAVHDRVMSLIREQPIPGSDSLVRIQDRKSRLGGHRWAGVAAGLAAASVAGIAGMVMLGSATQPGGSEMAASQPDTSTHVAAEAAPLASDVAADPQAAGSPRRDFDSGPELVRAVPGLLAAATGEIDMDPGCLNQLSMLSAVSGQPAVLSQPITYQGLESLLVVLAKPAGTWDIWVVAPSCSGADPGVRQLINAPAAPR